MSEESTNLDAPAEPDALTPEELEAVDAAILDPETHEWNADLRAAFSHKNRLYRRLVEGDLTTALVHAERLVAMTETMAVNAGVVYRAIARKMERDG